MNIGFIFKFIFVVASVTAHEFFLMSFLKFQAYFL